MTEEKLHKIMLAYKKKHGFTLENHDNYKWALETIRKHKLEEETKDSKNQENS
ncbi:hypothetical protein ACFSTE_07360 [Aquimarina hainanensis]|uniref:Uncharacterized protein n=1 Tax=Aquimarina hainanensis TaxID=1578017 RepID=A0ABW5N8Y0_9FLAO|nr:hypothetical protein [Aquimarina sp. TRL1]QKX05062.1 hypothetical protein HN014_09075 [Aquimarina sp. TRL1]